MANATVEKLKVFGLRHGEKVAMGVVAGIFVLCAYTAWSHPSLDVTADEIAKAASRASANLNAPQKPEQIRERLDQEGVKLVGFEKKVEALQTTVADASKYVLAKTFVKPEPGAGLLRDQPELLAPTRVYAHASRGAVRVIVLDEDGNPKMKSPEEAKKATPKRRRPRMASSGGSSGSGSGSGSGPGAPSGKTGPLAAAAKAKAEAEALRRTQKGVVGAEEKADEATEEETAEMSPTDKPEDTLQGYRLVNLVATFDHLKQKELYSKALKVDVASANPNYLRVDLERQELNGNGSWSEWEKVDRSAYEEVKKRLTKEETEYAPADTILAPLVDSLPFLEVGYWVGAHHGALVPKEVIKPKATPKATGGSSYSSSSGSDSSMQQMQQMQEMAAMSSMSGSGGGGSSSPGMMSPGVSVAEGDFPKTSAETILIRALDFSVKPDATYRYRLRVVVGNPNLHVESVSPGVDNKAKELHGPWSEVTEEVGVPADVATYVLGKTPSGADPTGAKVDFQVVKWSPEDGLTVVTKYDEAPGQIIGDVRGAYVPNKDNDGLVQKRYDFTSRQILADSVGGGRPASALQSLGVTHFDAPAMALVVRPDGMLVIRDQASDANNGEMAEMRDIYEQIKSGAVPGKKKASSSLYSSSSMSGPGS